jgi:6-pyruvoyltetrahydropterin/6-carboxytetrahydropterin synthase
LFTISVETHFQASHQLTFPDGSKEPLHRHNWLVTADVSGEELNSTGFVMDFHQLKAMVDNIVAEFDGGRLGENDYFQQNSSSAESVAKYIYEELSAKLPEGVELEAVKVVEQPGCSAKFSKSD